GGRGGRSRTADGRGIEAADSGAGSRGDRLGAGNRGEATVRVPSKRVAQVRGEPRVSRTSAGRPPHERLLLNKEDGRRTQREAVICMPRALRARGDPPRLPPCQPAELAVSAAAFRRKH